MRDNQKDTIKVKELMGMEIDIDICDDYDNSLFIAFCGAMRIKPEGKKEWADVLKYDIELDSTYPVATLRVSVDSEKETERRLSRAKKFFYSLAGYCADKDFEKWFEII